MAEILTGLYAVTIHVRDVANARTFYRDVLGLTERSFDERLQRAVFALPGTSTLLTMHVQSPGEEGRDPGTVSGIIFRSADPVAACAEILRRGGTVTHEPKGVEPLGVTFYRGVFADPDGNEFVLSDRKD